MSLAVVDQMAVSDYNRLVEQQRIQAYILLGAFTTVIGLFYFALSHRKYRDDDD